MSKIAYLSTFYPYRGGIAQFNHNLFPAFRQAKAFTFTRQYPNFLFPGKTQFSEKKDDNIQAIRVLDTINPFSYFLTAQEITRYQPDVLLMKYWMPFFAPSFGTVSALLRRKGIKSIAILDNIAPHEKRPFDKWLNQFFVNQIDGFVVMSETVKKDLLRLKPNARYIQLPHPLYNHFGDKISKSEARRQLGIPEDKRVILFFGLIRHYKGLDLLINAFTKLSHDYFLLAAGDPYEDITDYQKLLSACDSSTYRFDPYYIADSEVVPYFSAADLCVLPYKTATQSGVVSIALHFGLPLLVTRVGSLADIVEQFETGIVVEKPEVEQIRQGIEYFFNQGSLYYEPGLTKAKQELSWGKFAEQLVAFSKEIQH